MLRANRTSRAARALALARPQVDTTTGWLVAAIAAALLLLRLLAS